MEENQKRKRNGGGVMQTKYPPRKEAERPNYFLLLQPCPCRQINATKAQTTGQVVWVFFSLSLS